jgi:ERCC4-related helicase
MQAGNTVRHQRWGLGRVELDKGATLLVRFDHGYEECAREDLASVESVLDALDKPAWHSPVRVVTRAQAAAISSINDAWGLFSLSQIALLPHQLWVCHKVLRELPARWLIADDVGLGKTIEAGLILRALIHRGLAERILIICPASLTWQWQARLGEMFDIRAGIYNREADSGRYSFFETNQRVIASLQTIRRESESADETRWLDRLLQAPPWDVVIVDEAHHLNSSEEHLTLGYKLVHQLLEAQRVGSMFFFTGTPHRGANFGFLGLMHLLRENLFDPRGPLGLQLPRLKEAMIRNNKENVTDLRGRRLFLKPRVSAETYTYTPEETAFYDLLTDFIASGKAYASNLGQQQALVVNLVLVAMQKLASSSVAAIRRALRGRLQRIAERRAGLDNLERTKKAFHEAGELVERGDFDELARLEEQIAELSADLQLMEDEEPRLRLLLQAAELVTQESKIARLLEILDQRYEGLNVLFFTEYKATQSLLMSELIARYRDNRCVTFINGANRAEDVIEMSGKPVTLSEARKTAAARFNRGEARFLVSTEAGGEGIDLHESCRVLIHLDLPWNPMRLHQRVGRLNRYGQQTEVPVEVVSIRNPDTVEARIWNKLETKLVEIQRALTEVMEEPEDLVQLVLGMTSQSMFQNLFADAPRGDEQALNHWFNAATTSFGGKDVVDFVKSLAGSCEKFDFQQISGKLPKTDLPALRPFFTAMLKLNGRMVQEDAEGGIEFISPVVWKQASRAVRERYSGMHFTRKVRNLESTKTVLAIGNPAVDQALSQAKKHEAFLASLPRQVLKRPLIIFRITDAVTGEKRNISSVLAGVALEIQNETLTLLKDWELLRLLNNLTSAAGFTAEDSPPATDALTVNAGIEKARCAIEDHLSMLDLPFRKPALELYACLWPR